MPSAYATQTVNVKGIRWRLCSFWLSWSCSLPKNYKSFSTALEHKHHSLNSNYNDDLELLYKKISVRKECLLDEENFTDFNNYYELNEHLEIGNQVDLINELNEEKYFIPIETSPSHERMNEFTLKDSLMEDHSMLKSIQSPLGEECIEPFHKKSTLSGHRSSLFNQDGSDLMSLSCDKHVVISPPFDALKIEEGINYFLSRKRKKKIKESIFSISPTIQHHVHLFVFNFFKKVPDDFELQLTNDSDLKTMLKSFKATDNFDTTPSQLANNINQVSRPQDSLCKDSLVVDWILVANSLKKYLTNQTLIQLMAVIELLAAMNHLMRADFLIKWIQEQNSKIEIPTQILILLVKCHLSLFETIGVHKQTLTLIKGRPGQRAISHLQSAVHYFMNVRKNPQVDLFGIELSILALWLSYRLRSIKSPSLNQTTRENPSVEHSYSKYSSPENSTLLIQDGFSFADPILTEAWKKGHPPHLLLSVVNDDYIFSSHVPWFLRNLLQNYSLDGLTLQKPSAISKVNLNLTDQLYSKSQKSNRLIISSSETNMTSSDSNVDSSSLRSIDDYENLDESFIKDVDFFNNQPKNLIGPSNSVGDMDTPGSVFVRRSLRSLSIANEYSKSNQGEATLMALQASIERDCSSAALLKATRTKTIMESLNGSTNNSTTQSLSLSFSHLVLKWKDNLVNRLQKILFKDNKETSNKVSNAEPLIRALVTHLGIDHVALATLTLLVTPGKCRQGGMWLPHLNAFLYSRLTLELGGRLLDMLSFGEAFSNSDSHLGIPSWPESTKVLVGGRLISEALLCCLFENDQPAFSHSIRRIRQDKVFGIISIHPMLFSHISMDMTVKSHSAIISDTSDASLHAIIPSNQSEQNKNLQGIIPHIEVENKKTISSASDMNNQALYDNLTNDLMPPNNELMTFVDPKIKNNVSVSISQKMINSMLDPDLNSSTLMSSLLWMDPINLPMLVPPRPWNSWNSGGYLIRRLPCFRHREDPLQIAQVQLADSKERLRTLLSGLDILGRTSWRINSHILAVVYACWDILSDSKLNDIFSPMGLDESEFLNSAMRSMSISPDQMEKLNLNLNSPIGIDSKNSFDKKKENFDFIDRTKLISESSDKTRLALKLFSLDACAKNADRHSLQCDAFYKLLVATELKDRDFYLPHNVDFRGRAYPIPALLSHMGSDLCRGLVLFGSSEAAPLGPRGLYWLSVHLANVYGYDKCSFDDRVSWVNAHRSEIIDSAKNPFVFNTAEEKSQNKNKSQGENDSATLLSPLSNVNITALLPPTKTLWWTTAENPWQTLAACIELNNAWSHPQGPEAYITSLPVQQDGSCNGLQHYAALGRDSLGALHVNLVPGNEPADIYSAVAELVSRRIHSDAMLELSTSSSSPGNVSNLLNSEHSINEKKLVITEPDLVTITSSKSPLVVKSNGKLSKNKASQKEFMSNKEIAKWILSPASGLPPSAIVSRKIVKQSVMTSVYGVTLYGATQQVYRKLTETVISLNANVSDPTTLRKAARYIAQLVLSSLGEMFDRSRRIQAWLGEVVSQVTASVPQEWALRAHAHLNPDEVNSSSIDSHLITSSSIDLPEILSPLDNSNSLYQGNEGNQQLYNDDPNIYNSKLDLTNCSDSESKLNLPMTKIQWRNFSGPLDEVLRRSTWTRTSLLKTFDSKKGSEENFYPRTLMSWTSPLGFPITQPYREQKTVNIQTSLQLVVLNVPNENPSRVNFRRQIAAFAPNYIHSLDASHMFMTAQRVFLKGIPFASVHDSFWTHPKDVDTLHQELRSAFVELHSRPLLEELRTEIMETYRSNLIPIEVPSKKCKSNPKPSPKKGSAHKIDICTKNPLSKAVSRHKIPPKDIPKGDESVKGVPIDDLSDIDPLFGAHLIPCDSYSSGPVSDQIDDIIDIHDTSKSTGNKGGTKKKNLAWAHISIPPVPESGTFCLENVLRSPYFFS